eukprot:12878376-Alexandrium_andersonii.AAC.1
MGSGMDSCEGASAIGSGAVAISWLLGHSGRASNPIGGEKGSAFMKFLAWRFLYLSFKVLITNEWL